MAFVLLMTRTTVYYQNISRQLRTWRSKCAYQFVAQKASLTLVLNGSVNVIVDTHQRTALNGPGQTNVMTDVLVIQIKYVVDPTLWAFGQRHQSIWMDFVSMIILKTVEFLTNFQWRDSKTWLSKVVGRFVKDRIFPIASSNIIFRQ